MQFPILLIFLLFPFPVKPFNFSGFLDNIKSFFEDTKTKVVNKFKQVDGWDCGADKFWLTKLITMQAAQTRCPSIFNDLNQICRTHDMCYSNGIEGQKSCDDRFCNSLSNLRMNSDYEREQCSLTKSMCAAVRVGGGLVYKDKTGVTNF